MQCSPLREASDSAGWAPLLLALLASSFGLVSCQGSDGARGHATSSNAEGVLIEITADGTVIERRVGEEEECELSHLTTVQQDGFTPANSYYRSMSVLCPPEPGSGTTYTPYFTVKTNGMGGPIDDETTLKQFLPSAKVGEVRELPAYLDIHEVTAILTITKADGELLAPPKRATEGYIREYTLTAEFDCAAHPEASCEGKWSLNLKGSQTQDEIRPYTDSLYL